jgi:hypothetical protein
MSCGAAVVVAAAGGLLTAEADDAPGVTGLGGAYMTGVHKLSCRLSLRFFDRNFVYPAADSDSEFLFHVQRLQESTPCRMRHIVSGVMCGPPRQHPSRYGVQRPSIVQHEAPRPSNHRLPCSLTQSTSGNPDHTAET